MSGAAPADADGRAADRDVVARAVRGTRAERDAAFAEIFDALRGPVWAVCLHVTGDRADAEDALQETFLAVHGALARFEGRSRLSTWVHRIGVRTALRVRARRGRPRVEIPADAPAPPSRDAVEDADLAARVTAAMDRQPEIHRVVLSLFAVEGLSHGEIAEILGVPEGTVWSRLHAARRRLAEAVGEA